ncbi:MAG: inositol monophosphatase family protein [Anaerolineae bacterium]
MHNMKDDLSAFTFVAIQAALKAGDVLRKGFGTLYQISHKPGKQNLVTEYDKASEDIILSTIFHHFPDHAALAEESGSKSSAGSTILWIVDPLDGTVNFAHNIPIFSISIAASFENKTLLGIVYQPMTQELFMAMHGEGAYLNGTKLQVSKTQELEEAILATGFPYNVHENPLSCVDQFASLTKSGIPIRRLGSAAIDLAYVAAGRFDAYWEVSLHPWDAAAGVLLIQEAGGMVSDYFGKARDLLSEGPMLASNRLLHQKMIQALHLS